jgi:hypothetical protein
VLLASFILGTGLAQDNVDREGYFEVRSASTQPVDGVHSLDARLQLVLSSEALAALESGVTLTIELAASTLMMSRRNSRFGMSFSIHPSVNDTSSEI